MISLINRVRKKEFHDVPYGKISGVSYTSTWDLGQIIIGVALIMINFLLFMLFALTQPILIIMVVLLIIGLVVILFAQSQVLVLKMEGGNIEIPIPSLTSADVIREVSIHVNEMRE